MHRYNYLTRKSLALVSLCLSSCRTAASKVKHQWGKRKRQTFRTIKLFVYTALTCWPWSWFGAEWCIFSHQASHSLSQSAAFPEDNLLEKNLREENVLALFSGFTCGPFSWLFFYFPLLMLTLSSLFSFYPTTTVDLHSLSFGDVPPTSVLLPPTPSLLSNLEGTGCPLWLRTEHSRLFVLAGSVIRTCFSPLFHLAVLLFF